MRFILSVVAGRRFKTPVEPRATGGLDRLGHGCALQAG